MRVLIAAGGTGGHVNPALAVAGEIKKRDPQAEVVFVGTADRIESKIVPAAGYKLETIEITGFKRGFSPADIKANINTVIKVLKSTSKVKKIINEFKPDVCVGFGGYVSGPVVRTAASMGIPTAIHEQNAFPGITNKALAEKVDVVMLTSEDAKPRMKCKNDPIITGLPIRGEILEADSVKSRQELGFDDRPIILSMGGSLGSREINKAIVEVIASHLHDERYNFIVSTGQNGLWVPDKLKDRGVDPDNSPHIQIRPYINDMDRCLSAADIVICRAGASSLSEIQALGKPSILIPSPNVTENHQYHNAMALVNKKAALIIEESALSGNTLGAAIDSLAKSNKKLREIGDNAKAMAVTDATSRICDIVLGIAVKK